MVNKKILKQSYLKLKVNLFLILIIFSINLFCNNEYLISDSHKRALTKTELQNNSINFLKYARNEIFARNGFIFENYEFEYYFRNMEWYKKRTKNIVLNNIEKYNANLIKQIENEFKETRKKESKQILFKFSYNNMPLYYIKDHRNGNFVLLDSIYIWALALENIPVEFLEKNKIAEIKNVQHNSGPLHDRSQIKIKDIENRRSYLHYSYEEEIIVQIGGGDGDDPKFCVLGFAKDNIFKKLISGPGNLTEIKRLNNCLEVISLVNTRMPFSNNIRLRWLWNREKETFHRIPLIIEKCSGTEKIVCISEVLIYSDPISATERVESAIIGKARIKGEYLIDKYYFSKNIDDLNMNICVLSLSRIINALHINRGSDKGWINANDIIKFNYFAGSG